MPSHLAPHPARLAGGIKIKLGQRGQEEEEGMTVDEMAGWHHQLNGHKFG